MSRDIRVGKILITNDDDRQPWALSCFMVGYNIEGGGIGTIEVEKAKSAQNGGDGLHFIEDVRAEQRAEHIRAAHFDLESYESLASRLPEDFRGLGDIEEAIGVLRRFFPYIIVELSKND